MNLGTLLAPAVACCVATAAVAQPAKTVKYKLRNVAAADAALALARFAEQKTLSVRIVAEPISNTLSLTAVPGQHEQAAAALSALDVQPTRVHVRMMVMRVPAGLAEEIGLSNDNMRVLTPREASRLNRTIGRLKFDRGVDVLSSPTLLTADNQLAKVQVGDSQSGVAAAITPRVLPDDAIQLRVETQLNESSWGVSYLQIVETTGTVRDGGTLIVRGMPSKDVAGGAEVLTVLTAHRVKQDAN